MFTALICVTAGCSGAWLGAALLAISTRGINIRNGALATVSGAVILGTVWVAATLA